ncbi:hypothetical protein P2318_15270 [Myxococcaceae bacterium GXIMD 01537]
MAKDAASLLPASQRLIVCFRGEVEPSATFESSAGGELVVGWIRDRIDWLLAGEGEAFVSFGEYGAAGWVRIRVGVKEEWLGSLWAALEVKELYVLSVDLRRLLAITEEEYVYLAYETGVPQPE